MRKHKLIRVSGVLLILACLGFVVSFVRTMIIASAFGSGPVTDAYFVVYSSLIFIAVFIGELIKNSFIPIFAEAKEVRGVKHAWYVANNIRNIIFVGMAFVVLVVMLLGDRIIPFIVPGFSSENQGLTIYFLRLMAPALTFMVLGSLLGGLLNSYKKFILPVFSIFIANVIFILIILVFKQYMKSYSLIIAFIAYALIPVFIQDSWLRQLKDCVKFRFFIDLKESYTLKTLLLTLPIFITVILNQILRCVEFWLCSNISEGVISLINYARSIFFVPSTIFFYVVFTILFPGMSERIAMSKQDDFVKMFDKEMKVAVSFFLPFTVLFLTLSVPMVRLLYERGEFTVNDSILAAKILRYSTIGLLGMGVGIVLNQALAANKDMKTLAKVTIPIICFNMILDVWLVKRYSYIGIPLGAALCSNLTALCLFIALKHKHKNIDVKHLLLHTVKVACWVTITGAGLWLLDRYNFFSCLNGSFLLNLMKTTVVGLVIMFMFAGPLALLRIKLRD